MSNLFRKPEAPPPPQKPPRMPDPEDPAIVEQKRRDLANRLALGGRSSTILTGRGGRGESAFDSYSSVKLGAG